ncbi:MAG: hypothetical protein U0270_42150 [Labilithrix sp.]
MRCTTVLLALTVLSGTFACSKKAAEPTKTESVATKPVLPAAQAAEKAMANDGKLDPNDPKHGTRKLMGLDAPVYVDGAQAGVFRAGELMVPSRTTESGDIRWNLHDYLASIGVDMAALKSVHMYGNGDRIASLEGSEIRKDKSRFEVAFSSGDTGSPVARWTVEGLKNEFMVHEIRRIAVYVKKAPASINMTKQCHTSADGDCTAEIPYSDGVVAKGTRIYVDGKMVGFVKRRQVTDAMIVGAPAADPSNNKYAVAKLLSAMNVDLTSVKTIEVMAGDDVIARATGERFLAKGTDTTFSLPSHNHGKIRVHVPVEFQAQGSDVKDRDGLVSAVLVYKSAAPKNLRELTAISEDTDTSVQVAAIDTGLIPNAANKQMNRAE